MKHRPELQVSHGKIAETDQARCKAIKVEPPRTPWAPTEPYRMGRRPSARATARKGLILSAKTRRERGDIANGIYKRDRCKEKRMARQDIAIERQKGPPHKRTRTPPRRSEGWKGERLRQGPKLRNKTREVSDPWRVRTKERVKNSHKLTAAVRATVSPPAATGRQENPQAEAEAQPEGDISQHKRQPADRRKCRAGGLGSVPTVREEPRRDSRTPENPQPQRGPLVKEAPAAAGR